MAQEDKVKLKRLVKMVKMLNQRVQYLSHFIKADRNIDVPFRDKISDIEKTIE